MLGSDLSPQAVKQFSLTFSSMVSLKTRPSDYSFIDSFKKQKLRYARKHIKPEQFSDIKDFFNAGDFNADKNDKEHKFKLSAYDNHRKYFKDYDKPLVNECKYLLKILI